MIRLVPMSEDEFQTYLTYSIQEYAQEKVKAGNWHTSEAVQKAEAEFQQLLPAGLASKNQYLFSIITKELDQKIGMIWFAVNDIQPHSSAFIYDFLIFDEFRRQGYGTQALLAVEEKVKDLGIDTISLHVFGHNEAARALYHKIGYEITNINMSKKLVTVQG